MGSVGVIEYRADIMYVLFMYVTVFELCDPAFATVVEHQQLQPRQKQWQYVCKLTKFLLDNLGACPPHEQKG